MSDHEARIEASSFSFANTKYVFIQYDIALIFIFIEPCDKNEEYTSCGSACHKTCDHVKNGVTVIPCNKKCFAGCVCKNGYVRKGKECVLESECSSNIKEIKPQQ
ncbi:hypothetical protein B4U80_08949 [Leptotrombidium deliense]|uniref:TIL domain-containing protein n=1 Tax=Leptotrombidium deliense TaxID=299467 RepID=A0A443S0I0_9ACAR|nr:hypothetical protein B4U80_08949 [Leptotrombidium deliense]